MLGLQGFHCKADGEEGLPRSSGSRGKAEVSGGKLSYHATLAITSGEDRLAVDTVDEDIALGSRGSIFATLLAAMATYGVDDLRFGELIVAATYLL